MAAYPHIYCILLPYFELIHFYIEQRFRRTYYIINPFWRFFRQLNCLNCSLCSLYIDVKHISLAVWTCMALDGVRGSCEHARGGFRNSITTSSPLLACKRCQLRDSLIHIRDIVVEQKPSGFSPWHWDSEGCRRTTWIKAPAVPAYITPGRTWLARWGSQPCGSKCGWEFLKEGLMVYT